MSENYLKVKVVFRDETVLSNKWKLSNLACITESLAKRQIDETPIFTIILRKSVAFIKL